MSELATIGRGGVEAAATTTAGLPQAAASPRLVKAAHEFEAAMMKELMAPLTSGKDIEGVDGIDGDVGSSSALTAFASEALGKAISEHGGFGIAKGILHQLAPKSNHSGNPSVPGVSNADSPYSGHK